MDIKTAEKDIFYHASQTFHEACVDSREEVTVIRIPQAKLYFETAGTQFSPVKSNRAYRFGKTNHQGLGTIGIKIPVANNYYVSVQAEVVDCGVPFLLGLDQITNLKVVLDFDNDSIASRSGR